MKRTKKLEATPRAMMKKHDEPSAKAQQNALAELAIGLGPTLRGTADEGMSDGHTMPFSAARDLLVGNAPRLSVGVALQTQSESAGAAMKRVSPHLSGTVLPVQGPPGAGKTYGASRMIVELVHAGKKVGITGGSHAVITNLLAAVHEASKEAADAGGTPRVFSVQKPRDGEGAFEHPHNSSAKKAAEVAAQLPAGQVHVAAGTAWLWCDEAMRRSVDVLVIDEAGQVSLANALAVSVAADSLVLLGDPQQLAQPSQGCHPPGAGASALERLLENAPTIAAGKGLFMDRTGACHRKLQPSPLKSSTPGVFKRTRTAHARPCACRGTDIASPERACCVPVEHHGNVSSSPEEADRVTDIVADVLAPGATWTDRAGAEHPLGQATYSS